MTVRILIGDTRERLKELADGSIHCAVTSPPYFGLRDYGMSGQIGLEATPTDYVAEMIAVFREVRRALREDGTLWLNLGDSYAHKNLIGIPWRVAFALQEDGWYLRNDIIWNKPNPMPESVEDRCTRAHEYVFHLSKSDRYFHDKEAIAEAAIYSGLEGQDESGFKNPKKYAGKHSDKQRGHSRLHAGFNDRWDAMSRKEQCSGKRNKRTVWTIPTRPFAEAHFATMAPELAKTCIKAACPEGGTVLDPFGGAGTTGLIADRLGRNAVLIELNPEYAEITRKRIAGDNPMFTTVETDAA